MLRKTGAVLLVVGLCLPYGCDSTPVTVLWTSWDDLPLLLTVGIPVLAVVAYALHELVPAVARFHERHGPALHGLLRAVFFLLAGAFLMQGLGGKQDDWPFWLVTLVVAGALLYWQQQRGTKAQRLPLLLLTIVALPEVYYFAGLLDMGDLKYGAWVFTAGFVAAVAAEIQGLRGATKITHGG